MSRFQPFPSGAARQITAADLDAAFDGVDAVKGISSAKIGAVGWLEAMIPATELYAQMTSISTKGGPGAVFATRSSDDRGAGYSEGGWGSGHFAINNNTAVKKTAYGAYLEVRRTEAGVKGQTFGFEIGVYNGGESNFADPFSLPDGATFAMRASAGRSDETPNNNITGIAGFIGGPRTDPNDPATGCKFNSGFIYFQDCIADDPVFGRPIVHDMTAGQALVWRNRANGKVAFSVGSDVGRDFATGTDPAAGGKLLATNTGFSLQNGAGAGIVASGTDVTLAGTLHVVNGAIFSQAVGIQGALQFTGLLVYPNDAAAAAGNGTSGSIVPINGAYIKSATGAVTMRQT